MDEQDIGLHQFFGYIVTHVPEFRDAYRDFLTRENAVARDILEGFSGFVVSAWQDHLRQAPSAHSADTFTRLSEALEMGLRSQEDALASMIVASLQDHMDRGDVGSERVSQFGLRTQELLTKRKQT